jgi:sugar phosphate isomerase/epimerase
MEERDIMKLGIIAAPEVASFKMASELELEFLEFCFHIDPSPIDNFIEVVSLLKAQSEISGVTVESIGRWGNDHVSADGILQESLMRSYQLIDAAAFLNCRNYVCGCNYVDELSYFDNCKLSIEYFGQLVEYGKEKGVDISAYNCPWNNFIDQPDTWKIIHGHIKDLGIKYDPSHARYAGRDYLKEMKDWGIRFNHIHLKGSLMIDGDRVDDPPAGLDQTDWSAFMAVLYAKKYQGGLSIEPHSSIWQGNLGEQGIRYTRDYFRQMIL